MDGLMELEKAGPSVNFIPCLTWVRRGVAKPNPERVKLTSEELGLVIKQTQRSLKELEEGEEEEKENVDTANIKTGEDEKEVKQEGAAVKQEGEVVKKEHVKVKQEEKTEENIAKEYGLEDYDEEEEGGEAQLLGLGDLTEYADPKDDPYLSAMDRELGEEDAEDQEDFMIRGTDNLIVAGHVEGDSSTLEVYVYNDVEDALYIHHDILLPSFPLALEWLAFDPESDTRGSLVAVGAMDPIIQVWDLDLVDSLEPAFSLGRKPRKKKGIARVGHKDAVLALSWNREVEHVLASGGVDQAVLLWDLNTQEVAASLAGHKEKVQTLAFHPMEAHSLVTGCCDAKVRLYDCRSPEKPLVWRVGGEVERVVWDHFNPHHLLASTEGGTVHYIDARKPSTPLWTLSAHTSAVTGLSLSTQCPGAVTTVAQDNIMKVWDISGPEPAFVCEKDLKLGALHAAHGCPDAPFVVCVGGDRRDDNFKVLDIREHAAVRQVFGSRRLVNPLRTAEFGHSTLAEAEPREDMETDTMQATLSSMSLAATTAPATAPAAPATSSATGGAAGKFKKKEKKKKKKF